MFPTHGLGYGMLRYLGDSETQDQLKRYDQPGIVFNYLGQFGDDSQDLFSFANESHGASIAKENSFDSRIDCNSLVINGQLSMAISYNTKYYHAETVEEFAKQYHQALQILLEQQQDWQTTQWLIPSDVPMIRFTQEQINTLLPVGVTDAYPLSPLQKGILFHTLKDPHSGGYVIRSAFVIEGT